MLERTIKPKTCRCGCGEKFLPMRPLQKAATPKCALRLARAAREREERKAHRAQKIAVKPLSWWKAKAQAAVNAYIRERDRADNCISCGRWHDGQWHAGHYLSVGARPELRFHPDNIHKQCAPCNDKKSGNIAEYRPRLIEKIGIERVEWLEGPHEAAHYTREDCQRIEAEYKDKLKELRAKQ
jgi:hypothetical protein